MNAAADTTGVASARRDDRLALAVLAVWTAGALTFRGLIQGVIARRFGTGASIGVGAAAYAVAHAPAGSQLLVVVAHGNSRRAQWSAGVRMSFALRG